MKTSELIKQLQELDPSGELDVVVGNNPVTYVENENAAYNGAYFKVDTKYSFVYSGRKIVLQTVTPEEAVEICYGLIEDDELLEYHFDLSDLPPAVRKWKESELNKHIKELRDEKEHK